MTWTSRILTIFFSAAASSWYRARNGTEAAKPRNRRRDTSRERGVVIILPPCSILLPFKLPTKRDHTLLGRDRTGHLSKKTACGSRIRCRKLRVIQCIRCFGAQLESNILCDLETLKHAHIPVIDSIRPHARQI